MAFIAIMIISHTHPLVSLLAGPLLGLVYAIFLPFIGIVMFTSLTAKKSLDFFTKA